MEGETRNTRKRGSFLKIWEANNHVRRKNLAAFYKHFVRLQGEIGGGRTTALTADTNNHDRGAWGVTVLLSGGRQRTGESIRVLWKERQ